MELNKFLSEFYVELNKFKWKLKPTEISDIVVGLLPDITGIDTTKTDFYKLYSHESFVRDIAERKYTISTKCQPVAVGLLLLITDSEELLSPDLSVYLASIYFSSIESYNELYFHSIEFRKAMDMNMILYHYDLLCSDKYVREVYGNTVAKVFANNLALLNPSKKNFMQFLNYHSYTKLMKPYFIEFIYKYLQTLTDNDISCFKNPFAKIKVQQNAYDIIKSNTFEEFKDYFKQ